MKSWFAKYRISVALDAKRPLSPSLRRAVEQSEDLRRFADRLTALDRGLKEAPPQFQAQASLHGSILRAVRNARSQPDVKPRCEALTWQPAPALVVLSLFVLGVWVVLHQPPAGPAPAARASADTLASAVEVMEQGQAMAQTLPDTVLTPLSDEWQRIHRDLAGTAEFLLASLP